MIDLGSGKSQRILDCFKDVPAALEQRIDVDYRKVIGAQCEE